MDRGRNPGVLEYRQTGALRLDTGARGRLVHARDEKLLPGPDLERDRTAPCRRKDLGRVEANPRLARETETVEDGAGKEDRIQPALPALAKPRVHASPKWLDLELGRVRAKLCSEKRVVRPDPHPWSKDRLAAQGNPRIPPQRKCANHEALGIASRDVLSRVNGNVDASVAQSFLEEERERATAVCIRAVGPVVEVAVGCDGNDRDPDAARPKELGDPSCLHDRGSSGPAADA